MNLIVLITVLCGAVSGDISEIINQSRKYLPPSREYLPPLLPEYQQPVPEASTYEQDPPKFSDAVEVLTTISPNNGEPVNPPQEFYIPVHIVEEDTSDNALRQYLPPLIASTTVVPHGSEKLEEFEETKKQINEISIEAQTTKAPENKEFIGSTTTDIPTATESSVSSKDSDKVAIIKHKEIPLYTTIVPDTTTLATDEIIEETKKQINEISIEAQTTKAPENKEFIGSTTTDIPTATESSVSSKDSDKVAIIEHKEIPLYTTIVPDTTTLATDEIIEATTVSEQGNPAIFINEDTLTTTPTIALNEAITKSATDATETEATTVSTSLTVVADLSTNTKHYIKEIETISTTSSIEAVTPDSESVNADTTEQETGDIERTSTTGHIEETTSSPISADTVTLYEFHEVSTSERAPITTYMPSIEKITLKSEPDINEVTTTTIAEYIQNGPKVDFTTEKILAEPENDLVRGNSFEINEVSTIEHNEGSTPETLLLEDGYHYSIPSILFGSLNV